MPYTKSELESACAQILDSPEGDLVDKSVSAILLLLKECEITFTESNTFFAQINSELVMHRLASERIRRYAPKMSSEEKNGAATGAFDFGHTSCDWNAVVSLGIYGLYKRAMAARTDFPDGTREARYLDAVITVYDGVFGFIERARDIAKSEGKDEIAEGLSHLLCGAPRNLFEAMQTTLLYAKLQHGADGAILRTLGRLDSLYYGFYKNEPEERVRRLVRAFYLEIDSWHSVANAPFAIGADPYRLTSDNELTLIFLEEYRLLVLPNTKLHFLYTDKSSDAVLKEAFRAVREGKNSIVFMSDKTVRASLERLGADPSDATDYHVVGCYECGSRGELTCSCNARVNLAKALEYTVTGGTDLLSGDRVLSGELEFATFEDFFGAFLLNTESLARRAMDITEAYERHYPEAFVAPILSSTYDHALSVGGDVYRDSGAKYNSSSLNAIGLATATDSLIAIKHLVFDKGDVKLAELCEILRDNWRSHEPLRLTVKNRYPKFGIADPEADSLAARTVAFLAGVTDARRNPRGGRWRLGLFSIDWRRELGALTGASADGRLAGEPLSQNTGATFGADRLGALAHMRSLSSLDGTLVPNGSVLDLDIHISSVEGDSGIAALTGGLRAFFALGGFAVHYNILDAAALRDAKQNPQRYPNLQVRLCGWNVLFNSLSDTEKDEFISRFESRTR